MRFAVDTWAPEYGSSREQQLHETDRPIDVGVELVPDSWHPIDPARDAARDLTIPTEVRFVDGVRRIDSRIWIADPDGGLDQPGVCASVAAGVVSCRLDQTRGQAVVERVEVERALFTSITAEPIVLGSTPGFGQYRVRRLAEMAGPAAVEPTDPVAGGNGGQTDGGANPAGGASLDDALYLAVHRHMTELENRLAEALTDVDQHDGSAIGQEIGPEVSTAKGPINGPAKRPVDRLNPASPIVFDGPLGARRSAGAVGYIKTQHVDYLADPALQQVLADLPDRWRTPIFHIGGGLSNWSWFLRLPGPRSHSLSGVVRLELPGLGDVGDAVTRADELSLLLPRFASEAHKDSRAPQNLYPIAGLERELRRRLGDAQLLDRALRQAAR